MEDNQLYIKKLLAEIDELKYSLEESNGILEAIKDGSVDALVLHKEGKPHIYSIESADYTYRILIEKFGEGALSISDSGLILYCNDYFAKLIGVDHSKITGTFFDNYVQFPGEFKNLRESLRSGPSKGEILLKGVDREIPVYVSLTDLHPNVAAIGVVVTDLTEKRKNDRALLNYQQELELKVSELHQTNKNLEQFIHVISHDLKEPIRKILTYTSHLSQSKSDLFSERENKSLGVINNSALRLNSLVDDLVKYALSAVRDQVGEVDLSVILKEVTDDLEIIIGENQAQVVYGQLPRIAGSKVQMRQLFSNLLTNAMKYRNAKISPVITISTEIVQPLPDKRFYKVSVKDNGIGMEESHLSKIFIIFQRLHLKNQYSGNGIGLAICKKIMENHHGSIDVESTINEGSTFNLYFPTV